jgi:hypothetical protein
MSKTYHLITEQGLVISPALCASAGLGGEVLLEIEPGKIAIRSVKISAEIAQRKALRYLLSTLGDALTLSSPALHEHNSQPSWIFTVNRKGTGEFRGELQINAETGEVISWQPTHPFN